MNTRRVLTLARRVIRQVLRDRRTVGLLAFVPMLVLVLAAILTRAEPAAIPLGVVNEDEGLSIPMAGTIQLGDQIAEELATNEVFEVVVLGRDEAERLLREGELQGVVIFSKSFTADFRQHQQATLQVQLEGSNPTRSMLITARLGESAMKALAGMAAQNMGATAGERALPVAIEADYLYAGREFDTMDYIAPIYIGFLAMFFVFLLTCVSFLRERSQGTMERLLSTPATRLEIVLGYLVGLGFFALVQVSIILLFTIWAIKIHYLGDLGLMLLIVALLAVVGVSLGMLASAFARNEFQVVQFIPLLIIPQALLSGTFWPVEEMPTYLRPLAYIMPLTYANRALRDVMLKGWGLAEIWPDLALLAGFAVVIIGLGTLTMRQEIA